MRIFNMRMPVVLHENHPVNFQAEGHLSIIRKFSITGYILRFGDHFLSLLF